ncbi:hypothetical protein Leryth_023326 [Lithospermum erythrorhizon]|nr:hypothetical protein Leryth_023326 [Lithospermum erythrorhizon]
MVLDEDGDSGGLLNLDFEIDLTLILKLIFPPIGSEIGVVDSEIVDCQKSRFDSFPVDDELGSETDFSPIDVQLRY